MLVVEWLLARGRDSTLRFPSCWRSGAGVRVIMNDEGGRDAVVYKGRLRLLKE